MYINEDQASTVVDLLIEKVNLLEEKNQGLLSQIYAMEDEQKRSLPPPEWVPRPIKSWDFYSNTLIGLLKELADYQRGEYLHKINAIKILRDMFEVSLADAKKLQEFLTDNYYINQKTK